MKENRGRPRVEDLHLPINRIQQFPHDSVSERVLIFQTFENLVHSRVQKYAYPGTALYEDCLQEGFVGLFTAVEKFDDTRSVKFITFATTVIDRRILDYVRSETKHYSNEHRQREVLDEPREQGSTKTLEDLAVTEIDDTFERSHIESIDAAQLSPSLRSAVNTLPLRQRQAIQLFFYADMPKADIASRLKVSRPRVTALLNDGVCRLRRQLRITA